MKKITVKFLSVICFIAVLLQVAYPVCMAAEKASEAEENRKKLIAELDEIYADETGFTYTVLEDGHSIRYDFDDPEIGSFTIDLESGTGNQEYVDKLMKEANMEYPKPVLEQDNTESPEIVNEDISKRGEYEKHFECADGSKLAVSYNYPIHHLNARGEWDEIDNTLTEKNGKLCNTSSDLKVALSKDSSAAEIISIAESGHTLSWNLVNKNPASESNSILSKLFNIEDNVSEAKIIADNTKMSDREEKLAQKQIQSTVKYNKLLDKHVDVEYTVLPGKIKENIVLNKKTSFSDYYMTVNTGDLSAVLNGDNSIDFIDASGEIVFKLETPYMYDSADEVSYAIKIDIKQIGNSCEIHFCPDKDWLSDNDREYPIVIDPSVTTPKTSANTVDTYIYDGCSASAARANEEKLYIGMKSVNSAYKGHRVYWKAKQLPAISVPAAITNATFYVRCYSGTTSSKPFTIYSATANWDPSTLSWATRGSGIQLQSSVERNASTNMVTFNSADLTNMVRDWYSGRNGNKGFIIKYTNESLSNIDYNSFYSSNNTTSSSYMPYLTVSYESPSQNISDGIYRIRNGYSGNYMTYEKTGNIDSYTTNVSQYKYIPETPIQLWEVKYSGNGFYSISPYVDSTHRLDINNASDSDKTNVKTFKSNGNNAQLFRFISCGNGFYRIMPKSSTTRVIESDGKSKDDRNNIQIWRYVGSTHQMWALEDKSSSTKQLIYHTKSLPVISISERKHYYQSPDFKYADKSKEYMQNMAQANIDATKLNSTEWFHRGNMETLFKNTSMGDLRTVLVGSDTSSDSMLNRFYKGSGSAFSNYMLTNEVQKSLENKTYESKVKKSFISAYNSCNGNITLLKYNDSVRDSNTFINNLNGVSMPEYGKLYLLTGLSIIIHGWQAHSIEFKELKENENKVVLTFKFWDIFGLDDGDFDQPDLNYGFSSWYILQHYDKYSSSPHKPFITYISYDVTVNL